MKHKKAILQNQFIRIAFTKYKMSAAELLVFEHYYYNKFKKELSQIIERELKEERFEKITIFYPKIHF